MVVKHQSSAWSTFARPQPVAGKTPSVGFPGKDSTHWPMAQCRTRRADDDTTHRVLLSKNVKCTHEGKITANFAPLGAEEVLGIQSDEESEGDWESDVDDDRGSDLSDEGSDMGDEVWNMSGEDFFLSEEEYDMNDENLNAAGGVSDAGGLDDY